MPERRLTTERAERAVQVARGILTEPHPLKHLGVRVPGRTKGPDFAGLTAPELYAVTRQPRWAVAPPRRVGHGAIATINALSGVMPTEAVLLGRLVADAAPPLGQPVSAALHDILDQYLPASLDAFRRSGSPSTATAASTRAESLLIDQLRLLHQATIDIQRAEAEHNDQELRVQQTFLRDRFAAAESNGLDLGPASTPPTGGRPHTVPVTPAQGRVDGPTAVSRRRLYVDHDAVTVLSVDETDELALRLAAPKGLNATLGVVVESPTGEISFASDRIRRRVATRKQAGFTAAQADVSLTLELPAVHRFLAYAVARPGGEPTDVVLFAGAGTRAEVPTTLFRMRGAALTVVASGYLTTDGVFLRNESTVYPDLRAACDGFGFDQVSWISKDTPVV